MYKVMEIHLISISSMIDLRETAANKLPPVKVPQNGRSFTPLSYMHWQQRQDYFLSRKEQ
jgi:hypothetical protein